VRKGLPFRPVFVSFEAMPLMEAQPPKRIGAGLDSEERPGKKRGGTNPASSYDD